MYDKDKTTCQKCNKDFPSSTTYKLHLNYYGKCASEYWLREIEKPDICGCGGIVGSGSCSCF